MISIHIRRYKQPGIKVILASVLIFCYSCIDIRYPASGKPVLPDDDASLHRREASIKTEYNIININTEDDFDYEANLLKDRFPGRTYVTEKRLMFTNYDQ
jgi:hypothetical protein